MGEGAPVSRLERARLEIVHLKLDESEGLWRTVDSALRVTAATLRVARVGVWFMTPDHSALYRARVHDTRGGATDDAVLPLEGWPRYLAAVVSRRVVAADDVRTDPRTAELVEPYCVPHGITSMLDVPLFLTGDVHGIVCHEHVGPARTWTEREIDFAVSVADMLGALLEQSMRIEAERRLRATRDASVAARTAAGIAHDVNTVLHAVSATAELARRTEDPAARATALGSILDDCRRSARILEQLRELDQPPVGSSEAIDLGAVVNGLLATLEAVVAPERVLELVASEGAFVVATRTDLERIVLNLVTNARDATPAGGTIRVTVSAGAAVTLDVEDAGAGIDPNASARLFEPYFTTKGDAHGGLGLFIVAVLSSRSAGSVSVRSNPGHGTTFRVMWPSA